MISLATVRFYIVIWLPMEKFIERYIYHKIVKCFHLQEPLLFDTVILIVISPIIPKRCKSHHQLPGKFRSNFEAFWLKLFDSHSDVRADKNVTL